jgi:hypothetical protein
MSTRFIITREHRRFTEFADAVRRSCTIGLCFGPAGVGKTLSARRYTHYDQCHQLLTDWGPRTDNDAKIYAALARRRTVLYTPSVLTTARALKDELDQAISRTNICIEQHLRPAATDRQDPWDCRRYTKKHVQLIIVDESERLAHTAMELLRDWYDRDNIALILIGCPGWRNSSAITPSSTAGSGSPTTTGPWATTNCSSSCNATGALWARPWTQTTSPTTKRSLP